MNEARRTIRVLLADDHSVVRQGIRDILDATQDITVIGEAGDGQIALRLSLDLQPDVILCDLKLPIINGVEVVRRLNQVSPKTRILLFSAYDDDEHVFNAIANGASGYLLKTMDIGKLPDAVRRANSGETVMYPPVAEKLARLLSGCSTASRRTPLTERETQIITLASFELKNKEIAKDLGLSVRTVEVHFGKILAKLGAASRREAVSIAENRGLIDSARNQQ